MQAQKEAPPDMQCKDKFLLQSVRASDSATANINAGMVCLFAALCCWQVLLEIFFLKSWTGYDVQFNKEAGNVVEECKLRVVYVPPPQPPSPVLEGSEEGSSPRGSVSDNGNANGSGVASVRTLMKINLSFFRLLSHHIG